MEFAFDLSLFSDFPVISNCFCLNNDLQQYMSYLFQLLCHRDYSREHYKFDNKKWHEKYVLLNDINQIKKQFLR